MVAVLRVVYPKPEVDSARGSPYSGILRVWQIDGVEGGKGARAAFLSRAAKIFEEENEGVFVLVTAHTKESAQNAVENGDVPDVLSFSGACDFAADIAVPLSGMEWSASQIGGETLAYPWCRGGYFLFSAEGDFSDVSAENTVFSVSENANVYAAAFYAGLQGDFMAEPTEKAYVSLINGKYKYMLGTQRDIYRFRARNFSVRAKALQGYSDIWQYAAVCRGRGGMSAAAQDFLRCLLSVEAQAELGIIGMMSVACKIYGAEETAMREAESVLPEKKPSAWLSENAFEQFRAEAERAVKGDKTSAKNLQNYLV